jgi:predicted acyltransferase
MRESRLGRYMAEAKKRFLSVDLLRGLAVAGMVIANNPGDGDHIFHELSHAPWHGWTLVDFVFPIFLFLTGVSAALAVDRDEALAGRRPDLWKRALRRAALLFGLGVFENGFPFFGLESLRIPGVLQRIAVVYLASVWLHVRLRGRTIALLSALVLAGYWVFWSAVVVPNVGRPVLDWEYNLEGWRDQNMMRSHIWEYEAEWDPEGLLSTFPAAVFGAFGVLTGRWLKAGSFGGPAQAFLSGLALHLAGLAWNRWFPINKIISTSSFVLFCCGAGIMLLAVFHAMLDRRRPALALRPLLVLGSNSLVVYLASEIIAKLWFVIQVPDGHGGRWSLQFAMYHLWSAPWANPYLASLAWSVAYLLLLLAAAWALSARGLRVRL